MLAIIKIRIINRKILKKIANITREYYILMLNQ